jgi:anti-sigma regulatory factor (Ser/Thr protein kinase)
VTRVVEIPTQFDDRSFDQFARSYDAVASGSPRQKQPVAAAPGGGAAAPAARGERLLFDAHATQWASPYGLVGLLALGHHLFERTGEKPLFTIPADRNVASYWSRAGFFRYATECFEMHGKVPRGSPASESDVLLEVTPVRGADDVHDVVNRIQERSAAILSNELGLEAQATMGFAMALSEACQNIVEHAGTSGWVAVQTYNWRRKLGRRVVVIAVADAGVGFRHSLEATQARRYGERWNDAAALEAALIQGVSRFRDPGRGQGLQGILRYVKRWSGKLSVRSGTGRIAIVPSWDDDTPLESDLPNFPGSQMLMIIPAQEATDEKRPRGQN